MKSFSRIDVPLGYSDVRDLPEFASYRVDQTVTLNRFRNGDAVCFRVNDDEDDAENFGWVIGLPGDTISIKDKTIFVNGTATTRGDPVYCGNCGPIIVPQDHLYVVTDIHHIDSVTCGPLPASAIIGRIGKLP